MLNVLKRVLRLSLALTEYERESAGGDEEDLLLLSDVRLIWGYGRTLGVASR